MVAQRNQRLGFPPLGSRRLMTASTLLMRTAATTGRAVQVFRVGYGMVLALAPAPAIRLATGHAPGRRPCQVARILGARHLIQAALTAVAPRPGFAVGSQVDAVHATSMVMLGAVSRAERRAALTDALAEAGLAVAGLAASPSSELRSQ